MSSCTSSESFQHRQNTRRKQSKVLAVLRSGGRTASGLFYALEFSKFSTWSMNSIYNQKKCKGSKKTGRQKWVQTDGESIMGLGRGVYYVPISQVAPPATPGNILSE